MTWLYLIILVFSALTLYFVYGDYKKERFSKKAFTLVGVMETVIIIITAVLLINAI